jgi:glutaredoxin
MAAVPTEIVMYARERFCPDVTRSRLRLTELGIEWTEFNIDADEEAAAETERLTGQRSVPTLVVGNRILVEPSNAQLDDALVKAGFELDEE